MEILAGIGYKAVEWKETSFNARAKVADEFNRAVTVTEQAGIRVSNFVILRDLLNSEGETAIADVKNAISATGDAGLNKLNLITGSIPREEVEDQTEWWLPGEIPTAKAWDTLFAAFEQLLGVAEKHQVYLIVEPLVGHICHDYFSTEVLLRKFESEFLAITFDPSHFFLYRNDIPWVIRQWREKIKHVHVKDAVGMPGELGRDFLFPILGEGGIDWTAFFSALDEINYQSFLSCEFESFKYMNEVLNNDFARAAQLTMDSLEALWRRYEMKHGK